jgi:23S rRNA (uridine2552-2'-O)-methyltransferase
MMALLLLSAMREVQDHYFHLAKKERYLSRAAYKLIEIDDRKKVLRPGDRVLDCGAAPGSWLQVVAKRVGPRGVVVGIDLQPIKHCFDQSNVRVMQGDFTATPPLALRALAGDQSRPFDVIISDMAPNTTGDPFSDHHQSVRLCHALLDACSTLLRTAGGGGNLVMKVFEGEAYPELLKRAASMFQAARGFKPRASRSESREMYVVATGFQPTTQAAAGEPVTMRSKPPGGWGKSA